MGRFQGGTAQAWGAALQVLTRCSAKQRVVWRLLVTVEVFVAISTNYAGCAVSNESVSFVAVSRVARSSG